MHVLKGRELWVVKLTTATDLLGVPNIKIVGNIHGNEPVGREIILHLIWVKITINNYKLNIQTIHCINVFSTFIEYYRIQCFISKRKTQSVKILNLQK